MLQKNERNKKSKKRQRKLAKALNIMHKKERKKDKPVVFNFSAIHLLHDPQSLAEKLFQQLKSSNDSFEIRLMQMNLISRLVGIHQLMLFNFYPFLQRYAQPHQRGWWVASSAYLLSQLAITHPSRLFSAQR